MPVLNWIGKEAVVKHHKEVPFRLLEPVEELSCGDKESGNLIIQGDNLHALKALLPRYAGKVKCIYIDPPYNTGDANWIYNDNVNSPEIKKWLGTVVGKEGEDLSRHDKWLCMIYPRIKLLHSLLSKEGVIFISINDEEVHNLIAVCNEIFCKKNQVAILCWEKKKKGSHLNNWITTVKEYVLVYCKEEKSFMGLIGEVVNHKETYPCINPGNAVCSRIIPKGVKSNYKNKNHFLPKGSIISAGNMSLELESDLELVNGFLNKEVQIKSEWRYGQDKIDEYAKSNELYFTRDLYLRREVTEPRYKKLKDWLSRVDNLYILELKTKLIKLYEEDSGNIEVIEKLKTEIDEIENLTLFDFNNDNLNANGWGSNEDGDEENRRIFGKKVFDFPKPTKLIAKLICSYRDKNSIILDSFAGSGTTAHAVINLNKKDGGNRKFILVEMEENIAKEITAERVKKVIKGYQNADKEYIEGLGGDFQFLKLSNEPIYNENGIIRSDITFSQLAEFVWFMETGSALSFASSKNKQTQSPLLGITQDRAIFLLFNGILKDKTDIGGNVLNSKTLEILNQLIPDFNGQKIVYAARSRFDKSKLSKMGITFKQLPYELGAKTWF